MKYSFELSSFKKTSRMAMLSLLLLSLAAPANAKDKDHDNDDDTVSVDGYDYATDQNIDISKNGKVVTFELEDDLKVETVTLKSDNDKDDHDSSKTTLSSTGVEIEGIRDKHSSSSSSLSSTDLSFEISADKHSSSSSSLSGTELSFESSADKHSSSSSSLSSVALTFESGKGEHTSVTTLSSTGLVIAGGPSVTTTGIDAASMVISNVAPGAISEFSTDAINGGQLYHIVDRLDDRIDRVGAMSAALSSIQPGAYNESCPSSFGVGAGAYNGSYALGFGLNHFASKYVMFNVGGAISEGDGMGRAGVVIAFGSHPKKAAAADSSSEVAELRSMVDALTQRIAALEAPQASN